MTNNVKSKVKELLKKYFLLGNIQNFKSIELTEYWATEDSIYFDVELCVTECKENFKPLTKENICIIKWYLHYEICQNWLSCRNPTGEDSQEIQTNDSWKSINWDCWYPEPKFGYYTKKQEKEIIEQIYELLFNDILK